MAIAFDKSNAGGAAGGSIVSMQVNPAANTILLVGALHTTGGSLTSLVLTGNNLTKIRQDGVSPGYISELWYLNNPPTGIGTVNGTWSVASGTQELCYMTFTGASGIIPDAQSGGTGSGSVVTGTVTSVADNCLGINHISKSTTIFGTMTFDTGQTVKVNNDPNGPNYIDFFSYAGPKTPAGNIIFVGTDSNGNSANWAKSMITIAPSTASAAVNQTFKTLMGAGNI